MTLRETAKSTAEKIIEKAKNKAQNPEVVKRDFEPREEEVLPNMWQSYRGTYQDTYVEAVAEELIYEIASTDMDRQQQVAFVVYVISQMESKYSDYLHSNYSI